MRPLSAFLFLVTWGVTAYAVEATEQLRNFWRDSHTLSGNFIQQVQGKLAAKASLRERLSYSAQDNSAGNI